MDSEASLFRTATTAIPENLPQRCPVVMPAQAIVPWTPVLLVQAAFAWVMEKSRPVLTAPVSDNSSAR